MAPLFIRAGCRRVPARRGARERRWRGGLADEGRRVGPVAQSTPGDRADDAVDADARAALEPPDPLFGDGAELPVDGQVRVADGVVHVALRLLDGGSARTPANRRTVGRVVADVL